MPEATQPTEQPHRNHRLFSDHYLDVTLPERPEWESLVEQARLVMREIAGVFDSYTPSDNEAQTEQGLVRPVLELLGHDFEVQPALATPDDTKRPDYVFYRDAASLNANKNRTLDDELLRDRAFAVGDAKYWDRRLDISLKGGGDPFTSKNPGYQISFYMQHAGTEWGILTNGRLWRLYHEDTAHKLDRFYEVDLHTLATGEDARRFLYFYAFFHRSAFEEHPLSLRAMLNESVDYARSVGDSLKTQVYEALRHLAQGFLDYPQNALTPDPQTLEDPRSAEVIKPYLRGQDIKRWSPEWNGLWMIVLKSSGDYDWPWSDAGDDAEEVFRRTYSSLYAHMKPLEDRLRKRQDKGRYWWELRSCAYYDAFEQPKVMYQEIQFHPQYGFDSEKVLTNNKVFFLSSADFWLSAVLNSPLMWWHNWRHLPHMKDEALSPVGVLMEDLSIAPPPDEMLAEAEAAVERLISLTKSDQEARRDMLDWLRTEFGVERPGQKLEDFASLDADVFVEEVRTRRPKSEGRLTPVALRDLRSGYTEMATPVREERAEAAKLERRLSDLVNRAYGLTPEEVDLLWSTAPPRMPRF